MFKKKRVFGLLWNRSVGKLSKKSRSSYFILQLTRVKVQDLNTLLVQEKVQLLDILRLSDTHIRRGCVLENQRLTSISQAGTGSCCESFALEWPPTSSWVSETTHAQLQGRSLCLEHVSQARSTCVLFGFKTGDMEGQGRTLDVVVGEELCCIASCMGSGIVVLNTVPCKFYLWCAK